MQRKFKVELLDDVYKFFDFIDNNAVEKILYNIDKAQISNDKELFRKLLSEIWEFRTIHRKILYRLPAFWNKINPNDTSVLATHGFIKKTKKTPKKEIEKALRIRKQYFDFLNKKK